MKKTVVVTNYFLNTKMDEVKEKFRVIEAYKSDILSQVLPEADAILGGRHHLNKSDLATCTKLKIIAQPTAGFDNIDISSCTAQGIQVCNSPSLAMEVSDIALFHIINAMRKCTYTNELVKRDQWPDRSGTTPIGSEINHKKLFVIGYGNIGKLIAKKARVLGLDLYGYSRHFTKDDVQHGYTVHAIDLEEGLKIADIIVLALPLTQTTHHLINTKTLSLMKKSATIVNIARGGIIDTEALIEALNAGVISAASLDVIEGEPLSSDAPAMQLDNLYLTPHIGSSTVQTRERMGDEAIDNLLCFFEEKTLTHPVNTIQ